MVRYMYVTRSLDINFESLSATDFSTICSGFQSFGDKESLAKLENSWPLFCRIKVPYVLKWLRYSVLSIPSSLTRSLKFHC